MFEILTIAQAYEADRLAEKAGIESYALMLRAGAALADVVMRENHCAHVQVFCGPGANGGDGYVAARILAEAGREVTVFAPGDPAKLKGDAMRAFEDWAGPVLPAIADCVEGNLIIDALFGAGLSRPLEGQAASLVQAINASGAHIISADLPSGVVGDNGRTQGVHILANQTVTFFRKKPAHVLSPARSSCGKISVADIGIPSAVLDRIKPQVFENHPALWPDLPPKPATMTHKHQRGHLLVRCGGEFNTGAARLAARAGLRTGAGLVTLLADEKAARVCAIHETEVMIREHAGKLADQATQMRLTATVIGPAGGVDGTMRDDVMALRAQNLPMVLDADGLSAFADNPEFLFAALDETCVLTPHEGEFTRLFPDLADRTKSKIMRAQMAAERAGCIIVLKGHDSVIAAPDGKTYINTNAPAFLATAGSGDVLAGIIGALTAQTAPAFAAAACGVWLHGKAGNVCGPGLIAGDLVCALPKVLQTQL